MTKRFDPDDSTTWPPPEDLASLNDLMTAPAWAFTGATRVSAAKLLDQITRLIAEYVILPSTGALNAVALWVLHTYAIAAAESSPRLHIKSAEKRSGKSRLLELLELLVAKPVMTSSMSAAALFRTVEAEHPTLLIDEVDAVFGKSRSGDDRNEDLRALLNAGHRRGARVYRCGGQRMEKVMAFDAFSAVALAGIGDIPTTIADRSIAIVMKRRAASEPVKRFRHRQVALAARPLAEAAEEWAAFHIEELKDARPEIPVELDDRAADGWEPLLALADLAGADWPARARAAATEASANREPEDDTLGVRLLADCRTMFTAERISSADLADRLAKLDESPWGSMRGSPLDARGLARMLKRYGIKPRQIRFGEHNFRGYESADFTDAWSRYCRSGPSSDSEPLQALLPRSDTISAPLQATHVNGSDPSPDLLRSDVAVKTPEIRDDGLTGQCHRCGRRTGRRDDRHAWLCSKCMSLVAAK